MSCLKESISQAITTLPTIYTRTGSDGAEHPEDSNLKDENQLAEELSKIAEEVLRKYPQIGITTEEAIMKSLFMWHGCLNIDKVCRIKDVHGNEPQNYERMEIHNWLFTQSNSNP